MSSFRYGKHSKKRIGVWIKYDKFINSDLYNLIKKDKNKRFYDIVDRIIVTPEYDKKTGEIWIEVWCSNIFNYLQGKYNRHSVFSIKVKPNPDWSCFGDLGTGLK